MSGVSDEEVAPGRRAFGAGTVAVLGVVCTCLVLIAGVLVIHVARTDAASLARQDELREELEAAEALLSDASQLLDERQVVVERLQRELQSADRELAAATADPPLTRDESAYVDTALLNDPSLERFSQVELAVSGADACRVDRIDESR